MKLQILSDLHLEFDEMNKARPFVPPRTGAEVIVLAGDIWYGIKGVEWAADLARGHGKPVVLVFGNHDYWGESRKQRHRIETTIAQADIRAQELRAEGVPLWFLEDDAAVINGVRFLGATLWTDYNREDPGAMMYAREAMTDFQEIAGRVTPFALASRHRESRQWLEEELARPHDGLTVVVTHHAPSYRSAKFGFDPSPWNLDHAYCSDLDAFIAAHDIALWAHGHTHHPVDYELAGTRVVSNPRGYAGYEPVREFDPGREWEV